MFRRIKNKTLAMLPPAFRNRLDELLHIYLDGYAHKSYSQEGEDMVLRGMIGEKRTGFYVDVGAFHPVLYSNTYHFYKKGWRGVNIDARPGSMAMFRKIRKRDINVEAAISDTRTELVYNIYDEPALNSFSAALEKERVLHSAFRVVDRIRLQTATLPEVLDRYVPLGQEIDFMDIDVEGLDYQVIRSSDWQRYRPRIVLVETHLEDSSAAGPDPIHAFLEGKGYSLFAKTQRTGFFIDKG